MRATKEALGWDPDEKFFVPDDVREHMNGIERGIALEDAWQQKLSAWSAKYPALREDWDQVHTGKPRPGWVDALPEFEPGEEVATRDAGAKVMEAFKRYTPTMIGGAADLVESTKTEFKGGGVFSATHAGRNIAFGIREHAMGAIVNGISLHNGMLKPYGSTFLIFSDYMRPAVRLSALSKLQSSGRGRTTRSGSARTGRRTSRSSTTRRCARSRILWFVRPADATETVGAWKVALEREDGPVGAGTVAAEGADARGTQRDARRAGRIRRVGVRGGERVARPDPHRDGLRGARSRSTPRSSSTSRACTRASSRCRAGSSSRRSRRSIATR